MSSNHETYADSVARTDVSLVEAKARSKRRIEKYSQPRSNVVAFIAVPKGAVPFKGDWSDEFRRLDEQYAKAAEVSDGNTEV